MIRHGNQIRLNQADLDWITKLTGTNPTGVRTVDDLNSFVDRHLPVYDDSTPESKLLGMLLADTKLTSEG